MLRRKFWWWVHNLLERAWHWTWNRKLRPILEKPTLREPNYVLLHEYPSNDPGVEKVRIYGVVPQ